MTDYIDSINSTTLESDSFDDPFVNKMGVTVFSGATFTANQFKTYSLADFIPFDGYDYEVGFECFSTTGSTSGNLVECHLISGTETSDSYPTDRQYATPGRAVTRASSTQQTAGSCTLVIKSYDRNVTFNNKDGSGKSGTSALYLHSIKRLGTNLISPNTNYISNVNSGDGNLTIGGEFLGGQWVDNYVSVASDISLGTSSVSGYSLEDILPNDGCTYEVLCSAWGRTGTTSSDQITLRVGTSSTPTGNCVVARQVTRTASYMEIGGQVEILAKSTDRIYVANSGSKGTCTAVNLRVCAYRRVGTNNTTNSKSICIKSKTLIPNVIVYGNPTISGSDVTDFSIGNYLDIPVTKYATATYIICFTTPSSTPSLIESIYHCETYFSIELDTSFNITTYNNGAGGAVVLFTPNTNTKYWVKVEIIDETSKTFSYSTDGTTYTTATTITDAGVDISAEFKQRLGNSSLGVRNNTYFNGTIHLDECSITVEDRIVWKGMDYKKHLPIGGYIADGQWVRSDKSIYTGANISNGTHTYNVTNYLPEDDVQYEILCSARSNTAGSSGSANKLWINRSNQVYGFPSISRLMCRSSSSINDSKSCIIVCTQKNGVIPIIVEQNSSSTTGACSLGFIAYRRIGSNSFIPAEIPSEIVIPEDGILYNSADSNKTDPTKNNLVTISDGNITLNVPQSGTYELRLVGGGGAGTWTQSGNPQTQVVRLVTSGGSGSGFVGQITLTAGTYAIQKGESVTSFSPTATNSIFGTAIAYAGGTHDGTSTGTCAGGAVPNIPYTKVSTTLNQKGNDGKITETVWINGIQQYNRTTGGTGASVYSDYGAGGSQPSSAGYTVGTDGLVYLKYIG